jgi:hypothetical protein
MRGEKQDLDPFVKMNMRIRPVRVGNQHVFWIVYIIDWKKVK